MASCKICYSNFYLRNKYFNIFSIYSRNFCSKDNSVTPEGSGVKDDSSKERPDEKTTRTTTSKKKESVRFKPPPVTEEKKEAAKQKLKSLLSNITITSENTSKSSLNLARPLKRITKKERLAQMEKERITPEKKMDMAVKAVASNFKEDSEKVESELKEKLTTLNLAQKDSVAEEVEATQDISPIDNKVSANLMSSVEEVASAISENPIPPRSELAKRLIRISLDQKSADEKKSMRSVIEGMVIKKKHKETKVSEKVKQTDRPVPRARSPAAKKIEHVNLFGAAPLNIFDANAETKPESTNTLWGKLQEREVRLLTQFAPANAFEEMIMWTEQGKHWKFPIDNETEFGEEENVGFHEHVFLERHLKGFPTKGPIRHFMELVCVGLSKNPYITVERKLENIEWFRAYFKEKEELLQFGEEENVGFHEHVFLERHLKGFPTKGPIRHFMELVCVGLSKNPYITVERKLENIEWFRAYFKEKEELLRECGALD